VTDFEVGRPLVNEIRSESGVDHRGVRRAV
jgi:hypothetical protein